ncbi:MAG: O-antigen ligase family protein [Bdellovibrionales bacterium]|nr:O-antigen ligase family protein [Bdellovibrionales bacterium]
MNSFPVAVHIGTFFLLINIVHGLRFLWKSAGFTGRSIPIRPWSFLVVACLVAGLAGGIALAFGPDKAVLALVYALAMVFSLFHPVVAVCFFIGNVLIRPWEFMPTNALMSAMPRLLVAMMAGAWALFQLRRLRFSIYWNRACTVYLLFVAWLLLAAVFSPTQSESLEYFIQAFIPISVISLMILNTAEDEAEFRVVRNALTGSIVGAIAVACYLTIFQSHLEFAEPRLWSIGLLGNTNDLGALIVMAAPLVVFPRLIRREGGKITKWDLVASFVLVLGLILSQSRGAFVALFAAGLTYLMITARSLKRLMVGLAALAPLPFIMAVVMSLRESDDLSGSSASRFNYLIAGAKMVKDHPLFGVGINNYPRYYEQYTPAFFEWGARTAHSSWVLVMSEAGIPGLLLFAALYLMAGRAAWRIRREYPEYLLSIVAYGVAMSFLSHTYSFFPFLLMFLVFGAERVLASRAAAALLLALGLELVGLAPAPAQAATAASLQAVEGPDRPVGGYSPQWMDQLDIAGSRGETLGFLLKARGQGCAPITWPAWAGRVRTALYRVETIRTEHPSFPGAFVGEIQDPLLPLGGDRVLCPTRAGEGVVFAEIGIPKDLKPGVLTGDIGWGSAKLKVKLTVWKMVIPEEPALPAYSELTPWYAVKGHYGAWNAAEAELARKYVREMLKHRLAPLKTFLAPVPVVGEPPVAELENSPTPDTSFTASTLRERPPWAYVDFPTVKPEIRGKPEADRYLRGIENAAKKLDRKGKLMFYLWDEPSEGEMADVAALARRAKALAPSVKTMVTTRYHRDLDGAVDILAPVLNHLVHEDHPSPETYQEFQKRGGEVWFYVSCMSHGCDYLSDSGHPDFMVDRTAAYIRSIPWIAEKYKVDAFLYYAVVEAYKNAPQRDPWKSLWDFSGNGDGTLFYPGRPGERGLTEHQPIASLRLKLWREASFDAEYLKWMKESGKAPEWYGRSLAAMVPSATGWSRSYAEYRELRRRMGDWLNGR